jgi:hypothetical protein
MLEYTGAWTSSDTALRTLFGWAGPDRWVFSGGHKPLGEELNGRLQSICAMALGFQFTRWYQWRVYLGFDGFAGMDLPTDPVGAQEAFRLRDIPEGRSRRAALRHWVRDHWRQNRRDPAIEVKVRAALRGATKFSWNGLRCKIAPSRYDLSVVEQYATERQAQRIRGEDRRSGGACAECGMADKQAQRYAIPAERDNLGRLRLAAAGKEWRCGLCTVRALRHVTLTESTQPHYT